MRLRYRADPAEGRLSVPLDGLTAIFHRPSGATHLLASPALEILDVLSAAPGDFTEVAARLAERFDLEVDGIAADVIADRLAELEAAGLVARV